MLVADEPMASIVREALEGFASGRFGSQAEVTRFLQGQPLFPRSHHGTVENWRTTRLLTQPLYAGYLEVSDWNVGLRPARHEGLIS